jgi:carbon storage regulator
MLVLARKSNQKIIIDGRITVKVMKLAGPVVKLGIEAPASVSVHRQEIFEEVQRNNLVALTTRPKQLPKIVATSPAERPSPAAHPSGAPENSGHVPEK